MRGEVMQRGLVGNLRLVDQLEIVELRELKMKFTFRIYVDIFVLHISFQRKIMRIN